MVRSVADRAFVPGRNLLEEVGDMVILTGKAIVSALPPALGREPARPD
jgi:phospholipid/cholesterol/gamma-HCH transport system permease protein